MLNRIIRITATTLGTLLLLAGCSKTSYDPTPGGAISFSAGSALLRDDAVTKGGTMKTAFDQTSDEVGDASADKFFVWGAKTISATKYTVFNGDAVTLKNLGTDTSAGNPYDDVWTYSPKRFWDSNASQYDFIAISGISSSAGVECDPSVSGHMSANFAYSPLSAQSDILAAGYQRKNGSTAPVHFEFEHVLSAVSVVVYNDSPEIVVTLNSYGFKNICTAATGTIQQSGNGLNTLGIGNWVNPGYTNTTVLGSDPEPNVNIAVSGHYPTTEVTDLMIPQSLEPTNDRVPQLVLDYQYDEEDPLDPSSTIHNDVVTPIRLETIKIRGSENTITKWMPGKKYNYEIHVRMGGGIRVTVTTTEWQVVPAETPGLTIL